MNITLRELTEADYRSVKSIFRNTFDRNKFRLTDIIISWRERSIPDSYGFFTQDGSIIGFMIASFHTKNKTNMYIDYIAIDSEYRGQGYGSILMNQLLCLMYKTRRSVHLSPERPELLNWYNRHGFYQTRDNYYNFHSYGTRSQVKFHEDLV